MIGKAEADVRVKRSLYQRGVGYSYDPVKIFMPAGAKKPVYAPYVEHVPPDTTAGIFWMKNRDPANWRDTQNIEHAVGKYIISEKPMTAEEWIKARATVVDVTPAEPVLIDRLLRQRDRAGSSQQAVLPSEGIDEHRRQWAIPPDHGLLGLLPHPERATHPVPHAWPAIAQRRPLVRRLSRTRSPLSSSPTGYPKP